MQRRYAWFLLACLSVIGNAHPGQAAEGVKGDLYLLGIALDQEGNAGGWAQVGENAGWKQTLAGTILQNKLYSAEKDDGLFVTDLATGAWKQVGKAEFGNTQYMFDAGGSLFTIEKSGSLFCINPNDGSWQQVGGNGNWKNTIAAVAIGGKLYTVESTGVLYETTLPSGDWRPVGKPDFARTRRIFAIGQTLYTIETDGSLYRISAADGGWSRVGQAGAWKNEIAGAMLGGRIFTAERDGKLYNTDPATGRRSAVGNADFGTTRFMFPAGGMLYTIEESGNLYRVRAKAGRALDEFDWCTDEMEKVFREQGNGLSRELHSKKLLGANATHAAMLNEFAWLEKQTHPEDLAIVYLTAHGFTDAKQGWGITTADGMTLRAKEVKARLANVHCPMLFFLETCECGGFAEAHGDDPPVPPNVTVICACTAKESTNNPLDIALAEALYGRADFNHDGVVDLDELIKYVPMRYKEWWPQTGEGTNTPVIVQGKQMRGALALTHVSKNLAAVAIGDDFCSAIFVGTAGENYDIHVLGWSSRQGEPYFKTNTASREQLCLPADGLPIQVEQSGHWKAARLLSVEGKTYHIRYLGPSASDDSVPPDRVRYPFGGKP